MKKREIWRKLKKSLAVLAGGGGLILLANHREVFYAVGSSGQGIVVWFLVYATLILVVSVWTGNF